MRLFEAIVDANHRALEGDAHAGLHPAEFERELPLVALTCVDARLNALFPNVLGLPGDQFIWLRNAGNIITGPTSSTMRSLALACAVKGGKEIAIIGHTDCQVGHTTTMELIDRLRALGIDRNLLPDNIAEFFGAFASERQNVIKAAGIARGSPLIGPRMPVHGLLVDIQTGKLEWLVNGYEVLETTAARSPGAVKQPGPVGDALKSLADFNFGEMKFPETKIGETASRVEDWLSKKVQQNEPFSPTPAAPEPAPVEAPPKIASPPLIRPRVYRRPGRR
jgi:carbonic anhydrase